MEAKKCDRCGGFYDPLYQTGAMAKFRNPSFLEAVNFEDHTVGTYLIPGQPDRMIDLCPMCTTDFILFMNGVDREELQNGIEGRPEPREKHLLE